MPRVPWIHFEASSALSSPLFARPRPPPPASRTQAFDQAAPVSGDSSPTQDTPSLIAVDERAVTQHETIRLSRLSGAREGSKTNEHEQTFKTVLRKGEKVQQELPKDRVIPRNLRRN
ncbi:hypothetical protein J5N97_009714 [Dioscorea zingiberensis]|uniref:Uncharacterized protein n=1 Tax=Dioscorea zingiberensis TaxID=325984 RepID=A0A9D5CYV5_9LILI|nr:hypothetical protein J5N97_009714 [Dioscorea zingiberensis]